MTARKPPSAPKLVDLSPNASEADPEPLGDGPGPDLEVILPDPANLTIRGIPATVARFQTRELLMAVRIITNGMGAGLGSIDFDVPLEEQRQVLIGLILASAPDAANELIDLLASVTTAKNKTQRDELAAIMVNPPIDVTLDIATVVLVQERDDVSALVGKARQLLGYVQAMYRTKTKGT